MTKFRIRLRFAKFADKIFISHLDFLRLFERAVRRAQIPVCWSEGFNPRLKISFPTALQLGVEGMEEVVEMEIERYPCHELFVSRLREQLPDGISVGMPEVIPLNLKSRIKDVTYSVVLDKSNTPCRAEIDSLLDEKTLNVSRTKGRSGMKSVDVRPSIIDIALSSSGLCLHIATTNQATAKPVEILKRLGVKTDKASGQVRITRTHVNIH